MTKHIIPCNNIPNQTFSVIIEQNKVDITLLTRGDFIYCSIKVNDEEKLNGIICYNKTNIIQYKIKELSGSLYFEDTQGNSDPIYYGLNDRWVLVYED